VTGSYLRLQAYVSNALFNSYTHRSFEGRGFKKFPPMGQLHSGPSRTGYMKGIENTSGPAGQGHTMAVGAAIAERFLGSQVRGTFSHKIFTYISDGVSSAEISQGAGDVWPGFLD